MELVNNRYSLESLTSHNSPSSIRRLRHRLVDTFERLSNPRSPSPARRSTFSSQPLDDDEHADHAIAIPQATSFASLRFLQRVEAVRLQHSIRKHGHRYYVAHVYMRSPRIPIYRRDPDHLVEHAYASFFALRDAIQQNSLLTADTCEVCLQCLAIVNEIREGVHDIKRVIRSAKEKEEDLERFIHCFIGLFSDQELYNDRVDYIPQGVAMANRRYLQCVEAVQLEHSIRKRGHRFYVIHEHMRSARTPIYRRDPDHQVDQAYAFFFTLRDKLFEHSFLSADECDICLQCFAFLREMDENPRDIQRILRSSKDKEQRLEHFLHTMLRLSTGDDPTSLVCTGCQHITSALVAFLRPRYLQTAGVL